MADELLRALGRRQRQGPLGSDAAQPNANEVDGVAALGEGVGLPFDDAESEALLDGAFAVVEGQETSAAEAEEPATQSADAPVSLDSRRRSRVGVLVAAVAAIAAAVLLVWFIRSGEGPDGPTVASLPSYAVTQLRGGTTTVRDRPDAPPQAITIASDATIDWVITPDRPVREALTLVIVASPSEGTPRFFVPAGTTFSPEGVARLRGSADALLGLPPGEWRLELIVAPAGQSPETLEQARAAGFPSATISATITTP